MAQAKRKIIVDRIDERAKNQKRNNGKQRNACQHLRAPLPCLHSGVLYMGHCVRVC